MKKMEYISPAVEITTWAKADVITTSGIVTKGINDGIVAVVADANYTQHIDYSKLVAGTQE